MNKYSISIILMCLFCVSRAQTTFTVTNTDDSGAGSLRQAILDAEASAGADIIDMTGITGSIILTTGLPNITQDLTINGNGSANTIIDGNNLIRPFFIGGDLVSSTEVPVVTIDGVTIQNGYAEGESPTGNAGGGAGMGGGMFVNNGNVTITNVIFSENSVLGGTGGNDRFGGGGDGGDGPFNSSGGSAAELPPGAFTGGTGGYGAGGGGGVGNFNFGGADGGTGGYGAGGGGAGGGNANAVGNGGVAGTFGGSGGNAISIAHAGGGGGAGLGGALYVRNGTIELEDISFQNNTATGGAGGNASPEPSGGNGQGRGGAIFNDGGSVTATFFTFSGNTASTAEADTQGTVTFITDVAITAEPNDQLNIDEGMAAAFSVTATGTVESYQWQVDDGNGFVDIIDDANYSGSTSATLDITCVPRTFHNYQYRVLIGGTLNDVTSQVALLTVTNAPDLMATIASADLVLQCNGESLTFTSTNQNVNTTPAYQWLLNGAPVQGETTDTFTGAVNEGDEVSLELTEPSSCFPRSAVTSNVLTVQRIKVDTVVIANTLPGRTDVGSLPYHLAQTANLPCNDIITVMDLRQLPQGSIISMDQALFTQSPVHIIGNGSDETIIRATSNVATAMLGRFHKLEGFKLENTSGSNFNGIDVFADSLVMFDVIVSDFNSSSDEVLRYRNFDVDNNRSNYYVDIDSIQLTGGRQIEIDVEGTDFQVTGSIKIVNSVFKNAVHHNIDLNFREAIFQEVLIKGNLFQDNDLSTMQAFFNPGVAGGTFTIEQNSVINQYREVFALEAEPGLDIDVVVRNNTFSETGVRAVQDFSGDYPTVIIDNVDAEIINNTMVGVQDVMTISTNNHVVFANNLVLDEINGVTIYDNATPDYTGSGNNIGIDIGDNNDLTSTTLQVIQSLTLTDPGGNGLLVYEPIECGPAIGLANSTYAPAEDQLGTLRISPSDIGAIEGTLSVDDFTVTIASDPFPFPGDVTFTPTVTPEENAPTRTYTYEWFKNTVSSATTEIYSPTGLVLDDEITLEVTPNNDLCLRPALASETVTIREAFSPQNTLIMEDLAVGSVATSIVSDASLSAGATFSLVAGTGDTDNSTFSIEGNDLIVASELDFESNPSLSIRLSVSDGGNNFEQVIQLTITDVNDAPIFTSTPTTMLERDDDFDYNIIATDDEGSFVSVEGLTVPSWLTFNINPPAPETILVTTEQTGLPNNVRDFVTDENGNIYYTNRFDDVIYKMDINGVQTVLADANTPVDVFSPAGIDIGPDGTIYVAVVSGGPNYDGGIYTIINDVVTFLIEVYEPQEIVVTEDNIIYVTSDRRKLMKIENGTVSVVAGTENRSVTDGPFGIGEIANPYGMAVSRDGIVWLRDGSNLRYITNDGTITTVTPDQANSDFTSINTEGDLEVDHLGNVFFTNTAKIGVIPAGTSSFMNYIGGNAGATVDGNQNTALWGRMEALYFDGTGNLWTLGSSANTNTIPQEIRKVEIPASTYSLNGNASIVGEFPVSLRASDGTSITNQDFTIEVLGPLRFEADPVTTSAEGTQYIYNPSAIHSQSTAFTYEFILPDWLDTSVPSTATSFLNVSSGVAGFAPFSGEDATVTDEAVYSIGGNTIGVLKFDGSMMTPIDFSSLNPEPSVIGPFITSNTEGELYFAFKIEDPSAGEQDKLYKVDPNADPIVFTDLGTFIDIKDIDFHENGVVILEQRFDNNSLVGDISIVDDAGVVTSVISGSDAEAINVGLDGKIYFLGGSNFQHDDHSEFIGELELNGTFTTQTIFTDERVYSVQDLVVDAFGNAYILYESLDEMARIYDSYGYLENSSVIEPLFTATDDVNTFELSGFTRFGSTNDIFYFANDNAAGVSDLFAYADNAIIFGTPGSTDAGPNNVTITLDDQNEIVTQTFDIDVDFINDAPTGLEISGNTIDENNALSTTLLTFNTIDPDGSGDTFTYELISGTGDTHNDEFTIVDDGLQALQVYNAEANPGIKSILVRSTDAAGESVEATFDITINNINEAPTEIALSGDMEVEENLDAGTVIGTFTTTDEDAGDTHIFSISGIGSDLFQVVGDELQTAATLDFEQGASYTLTITVEDAGQLNHNENFTITIIDDNPTDIQLSNSSVDEGLLPGAVVGTLSTADTDPQNTFTYAFVTGLNFNAFFELDGNILTTKGVFNASQFTSVTIRVSTTDEIGESFEKDLVITINDLTNSAPQLLGEPTATATQGELYTYAPGIYDFDGDQVNVTSTTPSWLTQVDQEASVEEFLAENGADNLEIDDDDNLYVTIQDANGNTTNILKYDDATESTSTLLSSDATSISFVDVGENGVIYFSDNNFNSSSWRVRKIENGTVSDVYFATGDISHGGYHSDEHLVLVETQSDNTKDIIKIDLDGTNKTALEEEVGFVGVFEIGADDNIHYATTNTMMAIDIDGDAATSLQPELTTDNQTSPYLYYISDYVQYSSTEAFIMYADNDNAGGSLDYLVKVTSRGEQLLWTGDVIYEGGKIAANASSEVFFTRDADSNSNRSVAKWNQAFTFFFGTPEDSDVGTSDFDFTLSDDELSNDYSFTIEVQNVNDAPTEISLSGTSIDENNDTNVALLTISSDDPDNDEGDTQTYALVSGDGDTDNSSFEIDGSDLKALVSFDHEESDTRSIRIEATDASGATYEQAFGISIADVNETPTAIELSGTSINENEDAGTAIGILSTVDPDDANDDLVFEIIEGSEFAQLSGTELQSAASFDFETTPSFTVTVRANDGVENSSTFFTIEEMFTISVVDVSESPSDIALSNSSVDENADAGITVGTLTAQDPDGSNSNTFSLVDGSEDNALFDVSGDELITASVFDFESDDTYTVEVQVDDGGGNTFSDILTITINDINEAPVFSTASTAEVAENTTAVITLTASDEDAGTELTYSIVDGVDQSLFSLDGAVLSFTTEPDFESPTDGDSDNIYLVTVSVSDGVLNDDLNLEVTVTDVNEAPTLDTSNNLSVEERTEDPISLIASDPDSGAELTYSLLSGNDIQAFDLTGNELTFIEVPDFESPVDSDSDNVYEFTLRVSDGTNHVDTDFTITVTDVNEAPIFGTVTEYTLEENTSESIDLSASDADANELTYNITGGSDQDLFQLNGANLSFINLPDFETPLDVEGDNVYELTIRVSDGTNEVSADFTVTVTDVNESPVFDVTEFSIEENSADPFSVVATDPDANAELIYTITGGIDQDVFSISGSEVSFVNTPDFESPGDADGDNVYLFSVRVSDGTNVVDADFTITVTDQNEAPVFGTVTEYTVEENSLETITFSASDSDAGTSLIYTIVGGADQSAFDLNGTEVTFVNTPDFETPTDADGNNVYVFNLQVSDGTNAVETEISITVTDVNESPAFGGTELGIEENSVDPLTVVATDPDANTELIYTITGGIDQEAFSISGSQVTFVNTPDFEAPTDADGNNVYVFNLQVSDGTNVLETEISVTVIGVNEAPNSIVLNESNVDENVSIGTVVGTLSSTDPDASFTHTYSLASTETNFALSEGQLITNAIFDFEDQETYSVAITVTDEGGLALEQILTISINDVVETKPNSSVEIDAIEDMEIGTAAFELSAVTNPENADVIWSVVEGDASISGTTLTPGNQPGTVVVRAIIEETDEFNASEDIERFNLLDPTLIDPTVVITVPQEVTEIESVTVQVSLDAMGVATISESDIVLSIESGPGTLNGNELTFSGAGKVVVVASLAGTSATNAATSTAEIDVIAVFDISGRALDADGNGFFNGGAFLVATDNFNESLSVGLGTDGTFSFQNVKEGDYYLGIGVPQTETIYLTTYLGDKSPILDPTTIPDVVKLSADLSGLVINMQSKPAPAVDLIDPETGGTIEFQAQGANDGQNRIILGRVEMGDPIPNTQVILSTSDGEYVADGLTDENGFITFEGLPTGDYRIGVEIPGVGRVETEIPVEEGQQADVTGLISEDGTVALEVEEVLSVNSEANQTFKLFPNPVVDQLNVQFENEYYGSLSIEVFDLNGKRILHSIHEKKSYQYYLEQELSVPEGTYLLLIRGEDISIQKRFIKL